MQIPTRAGRAVHRYRLCARLAVLATAALVPAASAQAAAYWAAISPGTSGPITALDYYRTSAGDRITYATGDGAIGTIDVGADPAIGTPTVSSATVSPPDAAGFTRIAMSADGVYGVAVGNFGAIYRTTDGSSWSQITGTQEYSTSCAEIVPAASESVGTLADDLYSVTWIQGASDATSTVWITGADGDILKSTNGGQSFTEVNKTVATSGGTTTTTCVANPGGPHTAFTDSAFSSDDDGYFIDSSVDQAIWATTDGLVSAHKLASDVVNGYGGNRLAMDPANPQHLWLVNPNGARNGSFFSYSLDGGQSWSTPRYDADQVSFQDIAASHGTVVAAGLDGDVYTSSDGTNFTHQSAGDPDPDTNWYAVAVLDGSDAVIGGEDGAMMVTGTASDTPDTTPPSANVGGPTSLGPGTAGDYQVTVPTETGPNAVNPASYVWSSPGEPTEKGSRASFKFSTPGRHVITLRFVSVAGNPGIATIVVVVARGPTPSGLHPTRVSAGGATLTIFRTVIVRGRDARYIPVVVSAAQAIKLQLTIVSARGAKRVGSASATIAPDETTMLPVRLVAHFKPGPYVIKLRSFSVQGARLGPPKTIDFTLR